MPFQNRRQSNQEQVMVNVFRSTWDCLSVLSSWSGEEDNLKSAYIQSSLSCPGPLLQSTEDKCNFDKNPVDSKFFALALVRGNVKEIKERRRRNFPNAAYAAKQENRQDRRSNLAGHLRCLDYVSCTLASASHPQSGVLWAGSVPMWANTLWASKFSAQGLKSDENFDWRRRSLL